MNIQEIDKKILELTSEYKKLGNEFDKISVEIEELESKQSYLGNRMEEVEEEFETLKKRLLDNKVVELNIETDDPFLKDFIIASYFCDKHDSRPALQCVNITDTELQACDGYRAIIIKNSSIPSELRNTLIKWDIREDFEQHINKCTDPYINIKAVVPAKGIDTYTIKDLTSENFYDKLKADDYKEELLYNRITLHTDKPICVNKEFMDIGLMAFKGETFELHATGSVAPVILDNENKMVMILPIRLNK